MSVLCQHLLFLFVIALSFICNYKWLTGSFFTAYIRVAHHKLRLRLSKRIKSSIDWTLWTLVTKKVVTSVVGLISNNNEMHRKWHSWLNGVVLTTCPSMWGRQRRLWWTSGETLLTTHHWSSTARLWRESAALNFWACTSQRTLPGPPIPRQYSRRHYSTYTFPAGWKEQVSLHPSSPPSTGEPLRVCWPDSSLSGTGTVVQQTARPSSGQWTQLQKSSVPLLWGMTFRSTVCPHM